MIPTLPTLRLALILAALTGHVAQAQILTGEPGCYGEGCEAWAPHSSITLPFVYPEVHCPDDGPAKCLLLTAPIADIDTTIHSITFPYKSGTVTIDLDRGTVDFPPGDAAGAAQAFWCELRKIAGRYPDAGSPVAVVCGGAK